MIFVGVSCPLCILITKWNKNVLLTSIIAQTGRGDHQPPQLSSDLSNWEPETLPTHQHQHHYQHQPVQVSAISTNPAPTRGIINGWIYQCQLETESHNLF